MIPPDDDRPRPSSMVEASAFVSVLQHHLGPHTARNAVRTFSQRALGHAAERFNRAQAELVLAAMLPMLRTLLGTAAAQLMTHLRLKLP